MRKVRYIFPHNIYVNGVLTVSCGKTYDGVRYISEWDPMIIILNNNGDLRRYSASYFEDVTLEYNRNDIIDGILE